MRIKTLRIRTRIGKGHDHITNSQYPWPTETFEKVYKRNCRKIEYLWMSGPKLTLNFLFLRDWYMIFNLQFLKNWFVSVRFSYLCGQACWNGAWSGELCHHSVTVPTWRDAPAREIFVQQLIAFRVQSFNQQPDLPDGQRSIAVPIKILTLLSILYKFYLHSRSCNQGTVTLYMSMGSWCNL